MGPELRDHRAICRATPVLPAAGSCPSSVRARHRPALFPPSPSLLFFFPTSVNISLLFTVHDFMCFPVFPLFFVLFTYRFLAFELRFPPRRISLRHLFSLPRAASYERSSWKPLLLLKFRTICTVWIMKLCQKDTRECL